MTLLARAGFVRRLLQGVGSLGLPVLCVVAAVLLYAWPAASRALEYDRDRIAAGEVWRLLTGHLPHWSADHLVLDAAMFLLMAVLCPPRKIRVCLLAGALGISLGLYVLMPGIERYRGLSGLDAALYALGAVALLQGSRSEHFPRAQGPQEGGALRAPTPPPGRAPGIRESTVPRKTVLSPDGVLFPILGLFGFVAKIGWELATARAFFIDSQAAGFVPVPLAHVLGALVGAALALRHRSPLHAAPAL